MSLVSVVYCQVEVSVSGRSLVQSSPTECSVSECDGETSLMRRPWPTPGCCTMVKTNATGRAASAAQYVAFGWVSIPLPLAVILKNLTLN